MVDAAVRFLLVERDAARAQHVRDAFQDLKIATRSWSSVVPPTSRCSWLAEED